MSCASLTVLKFSQDATYGGAFEGVVVDMIPPNLGPTVADCHYRAVSYPLRCLGDGRVVALGQLCYTDPSRVFRN